MSLSLEAREHHPLDGQRPCPEKLAIVYGPLGERDPGFAA